MKRTRRLSGDDIRREMAALEQKYGMDSRKFLESYHNDTIGDNRDFVRWIGLCRMASVANAVSNHYVVRREPA